GYFKLDDETKAVLDGEGWFHTGDIGEIDSDGFLRITDRKKDLIKTSGGKYIAPQELENAIKAAEPLIGYAMIHGDKRKFVSLLVTISEENARKWASENGISFGSYAELTQRPEIRARVQAAIDAVNAVQPSYATIKKFAVLDHDWSQETGELTPTLKVKRKLVNQKYKKQLDDFYDGETFD
ncbi:MAG: long-chain fatty acid--CoA ligase, partial [Myxococcales bacterium]